ncbi:AAA family ATPase [Mycetocola spongiae]|uniref:AAA family ATPase n=1 Tax=Mycetocola spongiae TaxID=2859226 RepID=UPI001CF3C69B|nr:SMC family ATPase [Mycetocola spongiae]UCR89830.1 SMC family ATPase [Mycetocola spongiae]
MKIHRLSITGFGPFHHTQTVDFDSFEDDGLFLIAGKTGAGKSSILDAISFALYDSVPRYDGQAARLRSDHCGPGDPTAVELEFSAGEERYRVLRSPAYERPKSRGEGTTLQKASAELWILRPTGWEALSTLARDVGIRLGEIVQLRREQFLQVILLAQNRFGEFLRAQSGERLELLRTLFGTARFERYERTLAESVREAEQELSAVRAGYAALLAQLGGVLAAEEHAEEIPEAPTEEWFGDRLAASAAQERDARAGRETAAGRATLAEQALAAARLTASRQAKRAEATARLAELTAAEDAITAEREALAAAERAAAATPAVRAAERATAALTAARDTHRSALAGYLEGAQAEEPGAEELARGIESLTRTLGALEALAAEETRLGTLEAEIAAADREILGAGEASAEMTRRAAEIPVVLQGARGDREEALRLAHGVPALDTERLRLRAMLDAAREAEDLELSLARARAAMVSATAEQDAATRAQRDLVTRQLQGYAGTLAAELTEGEPCPVCGATAHPQPAEPGEAPVTEADIAAARSAVERSGTALAECASAFYTRESELAARRAITGDTAVPDLLAAERGIETDLAAAREAETRAGALAAHIFALETEAEDLHAARETHRAAAEERAAQYAGLLSERAGIRTRLDEGRGGDASVAEAITRHTRERSRARELGEAQAAVTRALAEHGRADAALRDTLIEYMFEDLAAWGAALREDREPLRIRVRDHENAVLAARTILGDPELVALPAEAMDLAPLEEESTLARAAAETAAESAAAATQRHRALGDLIDRARTLLAGSAERHAEYERLRALSMALSGGKNNTRRMRLESFVLAAELEEIVAAANLRLQEMSSGRFSLEHDDSVQYRNAQSGLGLSVYDAFTGAARPTQSLSGGETFLASLALALGLAEVVSQRAGGIRLDTLFIDEGFGSLDQETLDIAMETLDGLRAGGRTVGVISHVPAMQERIPARLTVSTTAGGASRIS